MEAWEAAKNALKCVLEAEKGESLIIFCDEEKKSIGEAFMNGALKLGLQTRLTRLKTDADTIRKEISQKILEVLKEKPAIYINILRGIREEAPFRIELIKLETEGHKTRLGHCPGVTLDMLTEGALALRTEEHKNMQSFAKNLIRKLSQTVRVTITNPAGTTLSLSVKQRPFFTDTIVNRETMKWMNLPTGEVIVAPVEDSLEGKLICDMAVGGIGPIEKPVRLSVKHGKVQDSSSEDLRVLRRVKDSLNTDENSSTVGEFAFGVNPKARFTREFLEAEKMLGTIHIAFGNNSDFPGGKNPSKNHLDLLVSKPSVRILDAGGSGTDVLVNGVFQLLSSA
ncbi:aminopeptidase [Candidatus Bathyarchaeota archaeon]|nr:aminopeptidase [Candidatus Bathyarchaeota archaeon]